MKKLLLLPMAALFFFVILSCEQEPVEAFVTNQDPVATNVDPATTIDENIEFRGKDCFNFKASFDGCVGVYTLEIAGIVYENYFGALPTPGEVGPYSGTWASIITETTPSGNGATHYTLMHKFWIDDDNYFYTEDKAVCSPAYGLGLGVCLINDQMTIVGGEGIFENASGKVKTHGPLTIPDPACFGEGGVGSIVLDLHGRVCLE